MASRRDEATIADDVLTMSGFRLLPLFPLRHRPA
jgi:hypothetical protein